MRPGELVFTRDEFDPNAEIVARPVEEGFRRFAPLLHLHIGGQIIRTTGEHPFFVYNKGWTKAAELQSWDCVLTADGQWVAVEEVYDTGEWEVVYNVRIADHHTYFVGDWGWDFSVWAHNTNGACQVDTPVDLYAVGRGRSNPDGPPKPRPGDVLIPVGSPDSTLLTPQVPPNPLGMSTFNSVDNMTAGMGPPSGARDIWMIPAGTRLPNGVMYIFDNDPTGHYTLYVAIEMTWGDFREGIRRLPWAFSQRL